MCIRDRKYAKHAADMKAAMDEAKERLDVGKEMCIRDRFEPHNPCWPGDPQVLHCRKQCIFFSLVMLVGFHQVVSCFGKCLEILPFLSISGP